MRDTVNFPEPEEKRSKFLRSTKNVCNMFIQLIIFIGNVLILSQ